MINKGGVLCGVHTTKTVNTNAIYAKIPLMKRSTIITAPIGTVQITKTVIFIKSIHNIW